MKEFKTWSWGFVPAGLALALIWYEYWQSGRHPRPPATTQVAAITEPASEPPAVVPPIVTPPAPATVVATTSATPPAPPVAVIKPEPPAPAPAVPPNAADERLFTDPPRISLNVTDATLPQVAIALNTALGTSGGVAGAATGAARYTLDMKDKPLWDIFQALQDQSPFSAVENTAGLRLQPPDSTGGIRHFQRNGPAILFAKTLTYTRTSTGPGTMNIVLGTIIDPRIKVIKHAPITILNAVDEAGHVQAIPELPVGDNMVTRAGNIWTQTISWPAPTTGAKNITFHCEVRFGAELSEGAVPTVNVEDAENKVGQTFAVGDQQVRVVRFAFSGTQISVQIQAAQGGTLGVNFMVTDATGKSFGNASTIATSATFAASGAQGPFRLVLKGTGPARNASYQFELPEIPVP